MRKFNYLLVILKYSFKNFPGIYFCFFLTIVSVGIELLAMSSLMPLSSLLTGDEMRDTVIINLITYLGIKVEPYTLLLSFVSLFLLRMVTYLIVNGLYIHYCRELQGRLSSDGLKSILCNLALVEIEEKSIGHFNSLAGDESSRASQILLNILIFTNAATLSIFYIVAIYLYSGKTLLVLIIFFGFCLLSLSSVIIKSYKLGEQHIKESKKANSIFIDAMSNIRSIRSFNSELFVSEHYFDSMSKYMRTLFRVDYLNIISKMLPVIILLILSGVFFVYQKATIREGINLAFFITIIFYLLRFFPAIGICLTSALRIISDTKAGKDVVSVVSRVEEKDKRGYKFVENLESISLKNVFFAYGKNKPVLKNYEAMFNSGETYALVGSSGSGKSTLANILLGFYEVDEGTVKLNNVPINMITRSSLRNRIILLSQKTVAFNDTIFKNLTFGSDMGEDEVWNSLEKVDLLETIKNLPQGLETELQYQGTNLSGGQLQRIGIARALLRNPDVVIFDESFSGLDSVTKMKILNNIKKFGEKKILIFITHDQEIMSFVDKIIDLEKPHKSKENCEEIHETTR